MDPVGPPGPAPAVEPAIAPAARPPVWQILLLVVLAGWLIGLTTITQLTIYVADLAFAALRGEFAPAWIAVFSTTVMGAVAAAPAAIMWRVTRAPQVRAVARTWTLAGAAFVALGAARLVPVPQHELYLAVLAVLAVALGYLLRRTGTPTGPAAPLVGLLGLAMLVPWARFGALGGLLETILAAAAAAAVGWLAARVLDRTERSHTDPFAVRVLLGGAVYATALAAVAGGIGQSGSSLAELLVLPPLGFAVAALRRGTGTLLALAAAGPLAFVDPEETSALLGTSDVGYWALVAAGCAVGVAVLVDVGAALTYGRGVEVRRTVAAGLAVALAATLGAVYIGVGQPGLHGERLFVVLKPQAGLDGIAAIGDRDQRLRETYRRLVETADTTQQPLRQQLRRWHLGFRPYYLVNGLEVDGGPAVRAWLSRRSDVDRVLLNPVLRPLPAAPKPMRGSHDTAESPQWNIKMIGADRVWSELGTRGAGIVIGTSDSGVDGAHPALANAFRGGDDSWYDPWNGSRTPVDRNGHGTHTLGTALGANGIGVAPDAKWMGCVNLDRNLGSPARYLDCLQFMLAPFPRGGDALRDGRPERAPHVLTNSWGCPDLEGCDRSVLRPAVRALTAAGIFFVAAAGNTGPSCGSITDEPAIEPAALTVGAVDADRALVDFSSRGPVSGSAEPDVVAPGEGVRSALPGGGYGALDGTSMAAPHVAGVVALMWSANPALIGDIPRTAELLRSTAQSAEADATACGGPRNEVGAGLVDAYAAVRATQNGTA